MGCTSVRFSPLEQHITKHSVLTGFEKHSAAHVLEVIKERSTAGLVLSTQFEAIKTKLGLKEGEAALEQFYGKRWRQEAGDRLRLVQGNARLEEGIGAKVTVMEAEGLAVVGILLSQTTAKQKSAALFDLFDVSCAGFLPTKSVRGLLISLFATAIRDLPLLVPMEQTSDDMPKYLQKCQEGAQEAVQSTGASIMGQRDRVSRAEFEAGLMSYGKGALLLGSGCREYAWECGKLAAANVGKKSRSKPKANT